MEGETGIRAKLKALDAKLTGSWFGRYYECEQRGSTVISELRAGLVCFLTVCYIIPVNSGILADTGGMCDINDGANLDSCKEEFKRSLIASTCIAAFIATFLMSVFARMPLAVAPAMGVNALFAYTIVGFNQSGKLGYKQALAAAFVEGWIFIFITVSGVRGRLVELIPRNIMYATAAGIGLFLAFIGLQASEGVGLVTFDPATLVTLGACAPEDRYYAYTVHPDDWSEAAICDPATWLKIPGQPDISFVLGPRSSNYRCVGGQMRSATTWLGICAGGLMVILMMKGIKASILYGILFATFISWIPNHKARFFTDDPLGQARESYWRKGVTTPNVSMTGGKLDFSALRHSPAWVTLITFLYLDFLDATSTMYAMARLVAENVPGFVNSKGQWPRQLESMLCDGIAIVIGSLLGTSPLTVFAESAVGIREGGRTGITALIVAFGFGISMFFSPIFASIPPYATGPALILVGSMMMEEARNVDWTKPRVAASAFLTMVTMPLTYSIAYGVIAGLSFCIFLWLADAVWETTAVCIGAYGGRKTLRHVWLDTMSHFYVAFNKEDVLLHELPGYVPQDISAHSGHASGSDSPSMKLPAEKVHGLELAGHDPKA